MPRLRRLSFRTLPVAVAGCVVGALAGCFGLDALVGHPVELTGKWVRLHEDGAWSDTLEYLVDGRVLGSASHPVPSNDRWVVIRSKLAGSAFCRGIPKKRDCQPFRLDGDTLLVLGGLENSTYLRRVR